MRTEARALIDDCPEQLKLRDVLQFWTVQRELFSSATRSSIREALADFRFVLDFMTRFRIGGGLQRRCCRPIVNLPLTTPSRVIGDRGPGSDEVC